MAIVDFRVTIQEECHKLISLIPGILNGTLKQEKMNKHNKSKNCPLCNGLKNEGTTTFTVDFGDGVVVIRQVPARVCSQCGADWISDDVAEKLENIVANARKKHSIVEVTSLLA